MAARSSRANIFLGERPAGTLHYSRGRSSFEYEDLDPGHPVLGLPFEYDPDIASHPVTGVPSWFANLLPERESALRRIYNRQLGRRDVPDFLLLIHLGNDLPGAVRVQAEGNLPGFMTEALMEAHETGSKELIGFSLSGLQLKFSMKLRGEALTLPAPGELGDWIVKLPSNIYEHLPLNEFFTMSWAAAVGIDVPEHRLTPMHKVEDLPDEYRNTIGHAFAVRRFDRIGELRVHQEDFAQIFNLPPADKDRGSHEAIARVILENCPEDFEEYIRRLVFCIGSGNNDEHLKNWSLRYADERRPRLSPAYDLVSVTSYQTFRNKGLTLPISHERDMRLITREHFRKFAESLADLGAEPSQVLRVLDTTLERMRDTIPRISDLPDSPDFVTAHSRERFEHIPLLLGR
ncbi:HipA domain-containing protein [Nocardia sp. NPDC004568]|uniref:type II toxin-antitoxin system HipA family toxin n=1 Tax=Nocardia sp. NPDC004568 TaxID=3154551 RepID=UPI0033AFC5DD